MIIVVCDRGRCHCHVWSWSWHGWTSCQCVDGLVGCVEGLLSGGASDRVVSSYEAERSRHSRGCGCGCGRGSHGRGGARRLDVLSMAS
jgi:hypothetical protein